MYEKWIRALDECAHCGLVYERNQGATWFFVNFGDRFFIMPLVALIYFGVDRAHPAASGVLFAVVGAVFIWTAPNRWGVCKAIHYLFRVFASDPDDPIPVGAEWTAASDSR